MKLSACYMVKNEANNLPQSLDSLREAVDEIIVVDTGSTDCTKIVAADYGARVYDFPWQEDFSAPRNFALDQVTGDWVVFLDADEAFIHRGAVRSAIELIAAVQTDCDGILIPRGDVDDQGQIFNEDYSLRIFPRRADLRYQGRIHENIRKTGSMKLYHADQRLYIRHTGYQSGIIREKCERNIHYLQREIDQHGPLPQYDVFLADCYFGLQDYRQALQRAECALKSDVVLVGGRGNLHHIRIESLRQLQAPLSQQLQAAEQALAEYPAAPEFYGERGMILCGLQEPDRAYLNLKRAVELYEQREESPSIDGSYIESAIDKIYSRIAELEVIAGNTDQAAANWERALAINPANIQVRELYKQFRLRSRKEEEKTVKISGCYIVRNEEKELERSIQSIRDQLDELIVVDTGSTDGTVQLAKSLGARVFQTSWQEDFSAPRNLALEQADGDWIVFLDADEFFSPETAGQLRILIEQQATQPVDGLLIERLEVDADQGNALLGKCYVLRAFRNRPHFRYQGRIHEELRDNAGVIASCLRVAPELLQLLHTGYSTDRSRSKAERNLRFLQRELRESKDPAHYYGYLADAYMGLADYEQAAHFARLDTQRGRQRNTYASRSWRILLELSEPGAILAAERGAICRESTEVFPEIPEFRADYAEYLAAHGDYQGAIAEMKQAMAAYQSYDGLEPTLFTAAMAHTAGQRIQLWQQQINPVTVHDAARALHQMVVVLAQVPGGLMEYEPWLQLLPLPFQHCLLAMHGQWRSLSADDEKLYPELLEWLSQAADKESFKACLSLAGGLSDQIRCQSAKCLMKHWQWEQAFALYQMVAADSPIVDGDFWKNAGKCLFFLQEKKAAAECFERAQSMGFQDEEMKSYQRWCQED